MRELSFGDCVVGAFLSLGQIANDIDGLIARARYDLVFIEWNACEANPWGVENLLRTRGVNVWGRFMNPFDDLRAKRAGTGLIRRGFWIRRGQAPLAEYLLASAGVSLLSAPHDARSESQRVAGEKRRAKSGTLPPPWMGGRAVGGGPMTVVGDIVGLGVTGSRRFGVNSLRVASTKSARAQKRHGISERIRGYLRSALQ